MRHRRAGEGNPRQFVVVLSTGDQVSTSLLDFAARESVTSASFTAIGAMRGAVLAFFEWESKEYRDIPVEEQVEVLSLNGNITTREGAPHLHVHAVLSRPDGSTVGGHFKEGFVRPTLEIFVTEHPGEIVRTRDEETGLPLISLPEGAE